MRSSLGSDPNVASNEGVRVTHPNDPSAPVDPIDPHLSAASKLDSMSEKVDTGSRVIALVGTPNSGKTTLFNWLTGSRFKTVNYPGATVDYSIGTTHERFGRGLLVMDTPGTYSLDPKSPDEAVTLQAIFAHREFGPARAVVVTADATQLARQLLLVRQLSEAGFRVILALTMTDLLADENKLVDAPALSHALGVPVVLVDGRLGGGVRELVGEMRRELESQEPEQAPSPKLSWSSHRIEALMLEMVGLERDVLRELPPSGASLGASSGMPSGVPSAASAVGKSRLSARLRTEQLDRFFLHPVWGLLIFFFLMSLLFSSIFWAAAPAMDVVDSALSLLGDRILAIDPSSLFLQFVSGGVIASLASVLVFVPQIFILFVGITLLEDSGYLARSATLVDRPLSFFGMGGRSFVPLLSGYACAVPAMMAARTINSRRERWLTLFVIPLMSCSARLPVYALLLSFLFRGEGAALKAGVTLTAIYLGSLVFGAIAALVAGRFIKIQDKSFFMMELPVYRAPKTMVVLRQALSRTQSYVKRAGPPIFLFALLVWLGTTFPNFRTEEPTERLQTSYAAQFGRLIEPIFEPMGGDWRTGVGLISAFAAREVFVSSLAVVFHIADAEDDATMQQNLLQTMQEAKAPGGLPLFTFASVLGLIVFFMIALQCLSTFMIAVRESGGWRFAVLQLVAFNAVAYGLAVGIVQGLRAIGFT
jgi:ferrous iron transport protein B